VEWHCCGACYCYVGTRKGSVVGSNLLAGLRTSCGYWVVVVSIAVGEKRGIQHCIRMKGNVVAW
jgi:hypothetical protein